MNNRHSRSKTWTSSCTAIQHFHCLYDFVPFGVRWIQTKKQNPYLLLKDRPLASENVDDNFYNLSHTDHKCPYFVWWHMPFCIWSLNSSHCISFLAAPLIPTPILLLVVVVVMLDLLNAEVLEGTELKEVGGRGTILTQHSHHHKDSALTAV